MDELNSIIILASSSPRRRELLDQIKVNYKVQKVDVDESVIHGETASDYVQRMSLAKARSGYIASKKQFVTLGADTCIELDGEILGKPLDEQDAARLLAKLSGREHTVYTAVSVVNQEMENTKLSTSTVSFAKLEQSVIDAYIATGEPLDKAGAYAIQGVAGQFITRLEGSYSSVMGLPLHETTGLLQQCGIKII